MAGKKSAQKKIIETVISGDLECSLASYCDRGNVAFCHNISSESRPELDGIKINWYTDKIKLETGKRYRVAISISEI